MKKSLTIILLCFTIIFAKNHPILDSLTQVFQSTEVMKLEFIISQKQYDQTYVNKAVIEFEDIGRYSLVSPSQTICVDDQTIVTYSPDVNQVVIEEVYPEDFNLLTLLTGDFSHLSVQNIVQKDPNETTLEYTIPKLEVNGNITFDDNYFLKTIFLEYDTNNTIDVEITSYQPMMESSNPCESTEGWEVIDLRE